MSTQADLLFEHIQQQGTPLRIDGPTETYYVLSSEQLLSLLNVAQNQLDADTLFAPEDFGVTQAEIEAYEARRQQRRRYAALHSTQNPLPQQLAQRLSSLQAAPLPLTEEQRQEREELLHELDSVILRNIEKISGQ